MTPPDLLPENFAEWTQTNFRAMDENNLAILLDANRHDEKLHLSLIELEHLPEKIADRLLRLIKSPALRELLIRCHNFSDAIDRNPQKSSRHRPAWWPAVSFQ